MKTNGRDHKKRWIAFLLAFVMVFTSINWEGVNIQDILAAIEAKKPIPADQVEVSKADAIKAENTTNMTTFDLGNGKKKLVFYGSDVRFKDKDGKLVDYDPTLITTKDDKSENGADLSAYAYENKTGDSKQYLPKELSTDTPILMENGEEEISFAPILGTKEDNVDSNDTNLDNEKESSNENGENRNDPETDVTEMDIPDVDIPTTSDISEENGFAESVQEGTPQLKKETVVDGYEQEQKKKVTAVYDLGEDINLEYQSLENGVKETIVLDKQPETGSFQFEIHAGNLIPEKNKENEGFTFVDPITGEIKASLAAPNMNDATDDAYSEDIKTEIEEKEGEAGTYILTVTADEDYLSDKNRQYPVKIDPTLTWSGTDQLKDVYVISGSTYKSMNFYNSDIVITMAGKASQGVYRSYMKFIDLKTLLSGYYIDSASLTLYEASGSQSGQTITAHQVTAAWNMDKITWSNQPSYDTTALSSFTTTGTTGTARTLDVKKLMTNMMVNGDTNYGLMIRNKSESASYGKFYGTRNTTTSRRPKLSIVVSSKPATASSVTLSSSYGKPGDKVTVNWAGITCSSLARVEYRIARLDASGAEQGDIVAYANSGTNIGNTSSGSAQITIPACSGYEEADYKIVVRGVDDQGGKGTGKAVIFHMDSKAPVFDSSGTKLTPSTSASNPTTNLTPTLAWNLTENNLQSLSYTVTLNGKQTASGNLSAALTGTATLPASCFGQTGDYTITLKAVDKAGNTATSSALHYYVGELPVDLSGYVPGSGNFTLKQQYGKNTLSWNCNAASIPNNISYRIYRGTTSDFTMDSNSLIADGIREKHWTDMKTVDGKAYYYKIQVVQTSSSGSVVTSKNGPDTVHADAVKESFYGFHIGNKDWKSYFSFDNAAGSGTVDESSGNLTYSQSDVTLPAAVGGLELKRTYNSQSDFTGMFGKGWSDSFHKELMQNASGDFYFTDDSGTVTKFKKNGNTYTCEESADYEFYTVDSANAVIVSSAGNAQAEETASSTLLGYVKYPVTQETTNADGTLDKTTIEETRYHEYALKMGSIVYRFNKKGRLVSEVDANNNFLLYNYDNDGTLKSVTTSGGKTIALSYNSAGLVSKAVLPDQTYLAYTYDSNGNLTTVKHADESGSKNITCSYAYSSNGLSSVSDFEGNTQTLSYSGNKVTKVIYADGETYDLSYGDHKTTTAKTGARETKPIYQTEVTYDDSGKTLSDTDASGKTTTYTYGYSANPYLVTKKESREPYEYLEDNKVVCSTYTKTETTDYDTQERVTKEETNDSGSKETTTYEYPSDSTSSEWNQDLEVSSTTYMEDANGKELTEDNDYTYDEAGNLLTEEDLVNDEKTETEYDEDGNAVKSETYATDTGFLIFDKDVLTQTETADYDAGGNPVYEESLSAPNSESSVSSQTSTRYDAMGREIWSQDESGIVTETDYDWLGRAIKTTVTKRDEDDHEVTTVTTSTYNDNGTVNTEANKGGITSAYTYDKQGRVTKTVQSDGDHLRTTTTSYGYDTIQVNDGIETKEIYVYKESQKAPSGTTVTYTDGSGETVRTTSAGVTTDSIIRNGRTIGSIINGSISLNLKNAQGADSTSIQNVKVSDGAYSIDSDSIVTKTAYDTAGNATEETDAKGIITVYTYDDKNRVTGITQDKGGKDLLSKVSYQDADTEGNEIVTQKDPKGHDNITTTNAAGLTVSVEDKGDGTESIRTSYEYDSKGNLIKENFANGNCKEYIYSKRNLLHETRYYEDGSLVKKTIYGYDDQERRVRMSDYNVNGSRVTPYRHAICDYDKWGRVTYEAEIDTSNDFDELTSIQIAAGKIIYDYDDADRLISVSYGHPDGDIRGLKLFYDSDGREKTIKAVSAAGGATAENVLRTYSYDSKGRVSQIKDYSDFATDAETEIVRSYTYDDLDRVLTMTYEKGSETIGSFAYTYDQNSNILSKTEQDNSVAGKETDVTKDYTYDTLGQLVKSITEDHKKNETDTILYIYDNAGNRTNMLDEDEMTSYTYNGLDQLTKSVTTKNGKTTSNETYVYDANGNEISVTDSVEGTTVTSTYDPADQLATRSETKDGVTVFTQKNEYNGDGQRVSKTDNGIERLYHYQSGSVAYVTDGSGNKTMQYLSNDGSVIAGEEIGSEGSTTYLYNKDIQNSTKSLLNADGDGVTAYDYSDFGETTITGSQDVGNEVAYTGGIYDESTGLYYLNARYYDPENGRFLTEDTYRGETNDPDTWHLYAYCNNDPVNYVDPSGHKYSPKAAAKYGRDWGKKSNPKYAKFNSDCTNFVSQCVVAGGKKMNKPKKIYYYDDVIWSQNYWYMIRYNVLVGKKKKVKYSCTKTWSVVYDFFAYWNRHGAKIIVCNSKKELQKKASLGDIVQFRRVNRGYTHSIIISGGKSGKWKYSGHSNYRSNYPVSKITGVSGYRIIRIK